MKECNDETNKLDEIHANSREIRMKSAPISYEFHTNFTETFVFTLMFGIFVRTNFVRKSRECRPIWQ